VYKATINWLPEEGSTANWLKKGIKQIVCLKKGLQQIDCLKKGLHQITQIMCTSDTPQTMGIARNGNTRLAKITCTKYENCVTTEEPEYFRPT
jgi:hypothetical protein